MDRVSGRVPFGKRSGPIKYPSYEEENKLIHFVTECVDVGYSYSRRDVIVLVPSLVNTDQKILKAELMFGEVPETMYGLSSSGWIDSEVLNAWFQNHF